MKPSRSNAGAIRMAKGASTRLVVGESGARGWTKEEDEVELSLCSSANHIVVGGRWACVILVRSAGARLDTKWQFEDED